jgi:hypothetical protein
MLAWNLNAHVMSMLAHYLLLFIDIIFGRWLRILNADMYVNLNVTIPRIIQFSGHADREGDKICLFGSWLPVQSLNYR